MKRGDMIVVIVAAETCDAFDGYQGLRAQNC
jgi:hypothetical protein